MAGRHRAGASPTPDFPRPATAPAGPDAAGRHRPAAVRAGATAVTTATTGTAAAGTVGTAVSAETAGIAAAVGTVATLEAPAAEGRDGLGSAVRRGLGLSLLNNALVRLGGVVSGIVIARMLAPADYGVFAVALVVLSALLSINELGVSLAIVRWPRDPKDVAPTVATLSIGGSVALYLLAFAAAPTVATELGAPAATTIIRVLAISMIIDGLSAVPAALLTRHFQQGRRLVADLSGFVVSTGVTIALAVAGQGAWSLAIGYLAGNIATTAVVWVLAPDRPKPGWDSVLVPELLSFGLPLAGSSLLVFAVLNAGNVLVGAQLGALALGFYTLAFNLSSWPVSVFSLAVRRVALAAFARIADDKQALADGVAKSVGLLLAVTLPVCTILALLADPLIRVVYGTKWVPAAEVLQWLALLGAARVMAELGYDLLVALARSRAVMVIQGVWLALLVPGVVAGARLDGVRGAAAAQALVACAVVLPAFVFAVHRAGVPARAALRHAGRPLLATAALVAVVLGLGRVVDGDLTRLLVLGSVGGLACSAVLYPMVRLAR
jgi:O-antigen/teichoic acid export membrane protein